MYVIDLCLGRGRGCFEVLRSFAISRNDEITPPPLLAIHSFRGDATNSRVWHHSKLHGVELTTAWLHVDKHLKSSADFADRCCMKIQWTDPLRVVDGTTAGTHSLYRKQLESVGAPLWQSGDTLIDIRSEAQKRMPYIFFWKRRLPMRFLSTSTSGALRQMGVAIKLHSETQ